MTRLCQKECLAVKFDGVAQPRRKRDGGLEASCQLVLNLGKEEQSKWKARLGHSVLRSRSDHALWVEMS
jgi:hypothetical protein